MSSSYSKRSTSECVGLNPAILYARQMYDNLLRNSEQWPNKYYNCYDVTNNNKKAVKSQTVIPKKRKWNKLNTL